MDLRLEDKNAKNTIIDGCVSILQDGVQWYDTEWLRNCGGLQYEVKYLRVRGLLTHHPLIPRLVRFKEQ